MASRCSQGRIIHFVGLAALFAAVTASASLVGAAQPTEPTTYRECYKSIRACQKSRCSQQDGAEQVSCMQQCGREYDSCTSAAGSGGSVLGFPQKGSTPVTKKERRNMQRQQSGVQN
ncbi:MAG TPA: hypothetical protein VL049_29465 [Candidatus Dormibacteraeota bacterium]|nr:hypothetical protein [Candidatus Dormibacteraeota bacterium]